MSDMKILILGGYGTTGGFHPGLPGVMVRWAANEFDLIEKAIVSSLIRLDWKRLDVGMATVEELLAEMRDYDSSAFVDGKWKKASPFTIRDYLSEDFGPPFGRKYCAPMFLEEMRPFPELYRSLKSAGFYVGGFNWFVDCAVPGWQYQDTGPLPTHRQTLSSRPGC